MNRTDLDALRPGAVIGIVGGGQLGRMLSIAAANLGFRTHIYCPDADSPAFDVSYKHTVAAYDDYEALLRFVASVDVVTYEFENVPHRTAQVIANERPLFPDAEALATTQDRYTEKSFLRDLGIPLADFARVDSIADLEQAVATLGRPSVLKTRRFGYDGKGQVMIRAETDLTQAFQSLLQQPSVLEAFVPFEREVSVVAARSRDGQFAAFDVTENRHENHVLRTSTVPASLSAAASKEALEIARKVADALDYVGVIGVEMFVVKDGGKDRILLNELAPASITPVTGRRTAQ